MTPEHIKNRYIFAEKWIKLLESGQKLYYAFLDEKWFYTTSRRKKLKILLMASFEEAKDAFIDIPRVRSRRFPCKVMFMGLVCPPIIVEEKLTGEKNELVDGKVLLKRVSKEVIQKQQSYNQHFVPSFEINHHLKAGEWRSLYPDNFELSINDFVTIIQETYNIDVSTAADLVFCYHSYSQHKDTGKVKRKLMKLTPYQNGFVLGNRKIRCLNQDGTVEERPLKLTDLELRVNPQKGKVVERDVTCDSDFMMSHIREIG